MILLIIPPEIQSIQRFRLFFTAELQKNSASEYIAFSKNKRCSSGLSKRRVCLNRRDYVARHCMTPYRYVMCGVFCVIEAFLKFFGHKKHPKLLSVAKKRVHLQTPNRTKRNYSQQNTTLNHYGLRNYRHLRGLRHMSARMPR